MWLIQDIFFVLNYEKNQNPEQLMGIMWSVLASNKLCI